MQEIIAGIYEIRNIANGHRYIGSSVNIDHRWAGHLLALDRGKHHSLYLQRSWDKWGIDQFEFAILERCECGILSTREQYYIDTLKPEYNICQKANSCSGLIRSNATRLKLSIAHMGKIQSQETINKRMAALRGHTFNVGRKATPETRSKMSASKIGYKLTEEQLSQRIAWRIEHPVRPEVGAKISASKMGHITTDETRAKMAAAKVGTHRSQVTKDKISAYWAQVRQQKEIDNDERLFNW